MMVWLVGTEERATNYFEGKSLKAQVFIADLVHGCHLWLLEMGLLVFFGVVVRHVALITGATRHITERSKSHLQSLSGGCHEGTIYTSSWTNVNLLGVAYKNPGFSTSLYLALCRDFTHNTLFEMT